MFLNKISIELSTPYSCIRLSGLRNVGIICLTILFEGPIILNIRNNNTTKNYLSKVPSECNFRCNGMLHDTSVQFYYPKVFTVKTNKNKKWNIIIKPINSSLRSEPTFIYISYNTLNTSDIFKKKNGR